MSRNGAEKFSFDGVLGIHGRGSEATLEVKVTGSWVRFESRIGDLKDWRADVQVKKPTLKKDAGLSVKRISISLGYGIAGTGFFQEPLGMGDKVVIREAIEDVMTRDDFGTNFTPESIEMIALASASITRVPAPDMIIG